MWNNRYPCLHGRSPRRLPFLEVLVFSKFSIAMSLYPSLFLKSLLCLSSTTTFLGQLLHNHHLSMLSLVRNRSLLLIAYYLLSCFSSYRYTCIHHRIYHLYFYLICIVTLSYSTLHGIPLIFILVQTSNLLPTQCRGDEQWQPPSFYSRMIVVEDNVRCSLWNVWDRLHLPSL